MLKLKRVFLILLCAILALLCGCTQTIESVSDELRSYTWIAKNENGTSISLSFDLNCAEMEFTGTDEKSSGKISGASVVSDNSFIITDTSMGEIFYFTYIISGDKAFIKYQEQEIEFSKVTEDDPVT